jgi:preprotein translocase subunit SecG
MKTRFCALFISVLLIALLITLASPGELRVLASMSSYTGKSPDSLIVKYKGTESTFSHQTAIAAVCMFVLILWLKRRKRIS